MDCVRGDRLSVSASRVFFKACSDGAAWFEIPLKSIKLKSNANAEDSYGNGAHYQVNGVKKGEFTGEVYLKKSVNLRASPYFFRTQESGQLQVFETSPPSDNRRYVLDCKIEGMDGDLHGEKGSAMRSVTFKQDGYYYEPGDTIPAGAADNYATINPDNDPPLMIP